MKRFLLPCALIPFLAGALWGGAPKEKPHDPPLYALSSADLDRARERVRLKDPAIQPALRELLSDADKALQLEPVSVMQKPLTAASGDKHDYFSMGPYWWPDPSKPDGKPFIRKDGLLNPSSKAGTDSIPLAVLSRSVEALGLAYYLTGKEDYATQAARLMRVWFINADTRMNPHLNYGQAIPGLVDGRCIGIIETHKLIVLTHSVALLADSKSWTTEDRSAFQSWLSSYLDWLVDSPLGKQEKAQLNNHGTWYDAQVAQLALATGRRELAREVLTEALQTRLAFQVAPDGGQPHEIARTRPLDYSSFNLQALVTLACQADAVGIDWWHYETPDGRSLRKALAFVAPCAVPGVAFIKEDIVAPDRSSIRALVVVAASHYDDPVFQTTLDQLRSEAFSAERWNLLVPAK
ncbi:MAG TPA: alginate lyase family protein [Rariglobus sp.]